VLLGFAARLGGRDWPGAEASSVVGLYFRGEDRDQSNECGPSNRDCGRRGLATRVAAAAGPGRALAADWTSPWLAAQSRGIFGWGGRGKVSDKPTGADAAGSASGGGPAPPGNADGSAAAAKAPGADEALPIDALLGDGAHGPADIQLALETAAFQNLQEGLWYNTWAIQELFRATMELTGLGWLESVCLFTIAFRALFTLPVHVFSMRNAIRLSKSKKEIDAIMADTKEQMAMQRSGMDRAEMTRVAQERVSAVFRKNGAQPLLGLITTVVSMFALATPFRAAYTLSYADPPVPSLAETPFLWAPSLAAADPTYVMPVLTCLALWVAIEVSLWEMKNAGPGGTGALNPDSMKTPMRLMVPVMGVLVLKDMPALMQGMIVANTAFQLLQSRVLMNDGVRRAVGLPVMAEMRAMREEQAEEAKRHSASAAVRLAKALAMDEATAESARRAEETRQQAAGSLGLGQGEFVGLVDGKAVKLRSGPGGQPRGAVFRDRVAREGKESAKKASSG